MGLRSAELLSIGGRGLGSERLGEMVRRAGARSGAWMQTVESESIGSEC
jgi:hypothetical protein